MTTQPHTPRRPNRAAVNPSLRVIPSAPAAEGEPSTPTGAVPLTPYTIAGIPSLRLAHLLAPLLAVRERPPAEQGDEWALYEERLALAHWACERTQAVAEAALGRPYIEQPEAQEQIIELAVQLIFSPDEAMRAAYRARRAKETRPPTP